jgi:hypothetical protein
LANGVLTGLAATLLSEQFESFGWRIPFLMSFIRVVVGIFIRLDITDQSNASSMQLAG